MGIYELTVQGEYRRAGTTLDACQTTFGGAVTDISSGRARDGRAAVVACHAYIAAVRRLQGWNARNAAMVEPDVAGFLQQLFMAGAAMQSGARRGRCGAI